MFGFYLGFPWSAGLHQMPSRLSDSSDSDPSLEPEVMRDLLCIADGIGDTTPKPRSVGELFVRGRAGFARTGSETSGRAPPKPGERALASVRRRPVELVIWLLVASCG